MADKTERDRVAALIALHSDADGPGKFEGNAFPAAASYTHSLTLDGQTAEECGTIEYGPGWHGLVYLDHRATEDVIILGWTADVDTAPESRPVAAIVREDGLGFVTVTIYDSEDAAQADWTECQSECDAVEDDVEDEYERF